MGAYGTLGGVCEPAAPSLEEAGELSIFCTDIFIISVTPFSHVKLLRWRFNKKKNRLLV
ncbi:hypothetical protein IscW_ISCW008185 [Ixodes scapularis]|uniref:Uncharacterized protein n=1 Tax=Ixodes scapularis TaxID=6945 RepID=B7PS94_IXOSC|nr:hypothetical protein IscW_ISCW008185 [Ixodes scapularis]|eukprot:XP_002402081.1 hypothetical protein IscW_ISCW008185 [Ixodes scapularis]